jgi:hypothetical protein
MPPIYNDALQQDLDRARQKYRRAYDRGFLLSQKGDDVEGQRVLDAANRMLAKAEANFAAARAANPVPSFFTRSQEIEKLHRGEAA